MGIATRKPAPPNAMLASAARINDPIKLTKNRKGAAWQKTAWEFYDKVGEYRYACDWTGAMISKADLKAGTVQPDGTIKEAESGPAFDIVSELFGDANAKREVLRQLGIHYQVAGEAWILGGTGDYGEDTWTITSSAAITRETTASPWKVDGEEVAGVDDFVHRTWRPHPAHPQQAISSSLAVLGVLAEIHGLHEHVMAQVESRLTTAGLMLWPSEMTVPTGKGYENMSMAQAFAKMFSDIASVALTDRNSAAAVVPMQVVGPADVLDKVRYLSIWSDLDEHSSEMRGDALRRLALGMDLPPEIITGSEGVNHWSSFSIDESAIKSHTEPLLTTITTALTKALLLPTLREAKVENPTEHVIYADTAQMRLRPNRSKEAIELYDRGVLGASTLLRETGFDIEAAPTPEELRLWILKQISTGSATPEMVATAAALLGAEVPFVESVSVDVTPTREAPSLADHPNQGPPDQGTSQRRKRTRDARQGKPEAPMALLVGSSMLVERALERAGNRLRAKTGGRIENVSAAQHYMHVAPCTREVADGLLVDAWEGVPRLAERFGTDPNRLTSVLDTITRHILVSKVEFCEDDLASALEILEV